jgi:hypothetical protein
MGEIANIHQFMICDLAGNVYRAVGKVFEAARGEGAQDRGHLAARGKQPAVCQRGVARRRL